MLVVFTDILTSVVLSPSAILSSTVVRVTSWGVFQLEDVNVNESGLTVTSFVFDEAISKTTLEIGWGLEVNTTVNLPDSPSFTSIVSLLTVKPATSLSSIILTVTVLFARPL